jgi:DNA polymerase III delta prime subunit
MKTSILVTGGTSLERKDLAYSLASKESSDFDIYFVDGAENPGIEQARETIQQIARAPFESKLKTVLIFEAQNLNEIAQNALLKTLEEPPSKTQIILTSPNNDSVLTTISSRCLEIKVQGKAANKAPFPQKNIQKLSERIADLDKTSLEGLVGVWGRQLEKAATEEKIDQDYLKKLHRYNKILLKLKKAEKHSVNKKLISLIAAIEQPSKG